MHLKIDHSLIEDELKNIILLSAKSSVQNQYDWLIYFDPPLEEIKTKNAKNFLIFYIIYQEAIKDRLSDNVKK